MAVAPTQGFRFVAGSWRLIVAYWVLALLAAMPGWSIGRGALTAAVGRRPYFTDAPDPLPLPQLQGLLSEVPGVMWGALAAGLTVAWLGRLALTAAAVEILDPGLAQAPVRVWRTLFDRGTRYVLSYLRVALVSGLCLAVGVIGVNIVLSGLQDLGEPRGWSARTLYVALPFWLGLVLLVWATGVGVYAFWARVVLVLERRRSVVALFPALTSLSLRRPAVFIGFHGILSVVSVLLAGKALLAWRQSPSGAGAFFVLWLGVLLLQACIWHWRLRVCCLVWAENRGHYP